MRIGIDGRMLGHRRGMGNLLYNLLKSLAAQEHGHSIYVYVDDLRVAAQVPSPCRYKIRTLGPPLYPIWEQVLLPRCAIQDKLDVLHCPANTAALWLPHQTRLVMTVHDVIYMLPSRLVPVSRSLYQRLGRAYCKWITPRAAASAAAIITDSQHSKNDLVAYLKLDPARVCVWSPGPGPEFRRVTARATLDAVRERLSLAPRFVVGIGARDARKNTTGLIEAFARFKLKEDAPHQLVLTGMGSSDVARYAAQAQRLGVGKSVRLLGFLPAEMLVAVYNAGEMFVYPSLYEGFGLPVLEAMACGTPVIASSSSSIPEVAGDAALFVDPRDHIQLAEAMSRVAGDRELRADMVERGLRETERYSWRRAATEVLNIYERTVAADLAGRAL